MQRISQIFKNSLNYLLIKIVKIKDVIRNHENNVNDI